MRDVRKVKNRLELRLDSTQVFFLFAGGVTFAAFIFVLGVVVGRAQRPEPKAVAQAGVTLPTPTPKRAGVADKLQDPDGGDDSAVETIYKLGDPDNPNSLAGAVPDATKKPTPRPTRKHVARATPTPTTESSLAHTPAPTPTETAAASRKHSRYTVQIAAYTDADQAHQFVERLREQGIEAYSVTYSKPQGPVYHRVRVGRFASKAEADHAAETLGTRVAGVKPAVMLID